MSSKQKTETTSQKNSLDPRMEALLYGGNGQTGITQYAQALMGQNPLNQRQQQGIDAQANYLQSPLYSNIFNAMLNQGSQLMGRGVAGNPFTSSQALNLGTYQPNYQGPQRSNPFAGIQQPQTQTQQQPDMNALLQMMQRVTQSGG